MIINKCVEEKVIPPMIEIGDDKVLDMIEYKMNTGFCKAIGQTLPLLAPNHIKILVL
jgi:hypothetical protein